MKIFLSYDLNGEGHPEIKKKMLDNGYEDFGYNYLGKKVKLPNTVLLKEITPEKLELTERVLQRVHTDLQEAINSYNEENEEDTRLSAYFIADYDVSDFDGPEYKMRLRKNS